MDTPTPALLSRLMSKNPKYIILIICTVFLIGIFEFVKFWFQTLNIRIGLQENGVLSNGTHGPRALS